MIKLTLTDVINVISVLKEVSNKNFPGSTTFKIARLMRELSKESLLFEEQRMKIVKEYGEKDEKGELILQPDGTVKVPPEKIDECNDKLTALFNTEIRINAEKLQEESFNDVEITPAQALLLEPIIKKDPLN